MYTKLAADLQLTPPLDSLPLCAAFHKRVRALPTLERYFSSEASKLGCWSEGITNWR